MATHKFGCTEEKLQTRSIERMKKTHGKLWPTKYFKELKKIQTRLSLILIKVVVNLPTEKLGKWR